jgi:hypothetical protein
MLRSVIAVLAGYLLYVASVFAFFAVSGRNPHAPASMVFMVIGTLYGMFFAALGGFLAVLLARRQRFEHAFAVAFLIAVGGAASILGRTGRLVWPQLAGLLIMAQMAMVGGYLRLRQIRSPKA